MSEPQRIQRRRTKGWRMPENTLIVDRSTQFGNPFPIAKGTRLDCGKAKEIWWVGTWNGPALWFRDTKAEAAELSVRAFREWIGQAIQRPLVDKARVWLRGKNLACWCPVTQPCHADVWLEVVNAGEPIDV